MAEETPPHVDTTSDRIFAAPRTDIIIGKELPPKTIETERLAENAIAAAYGALAASAMLSVVMKEKLSPSLVPQAAAAAMGDVSGRERFKGITKAWGMTITTWASLQTGLNAEQRGLLTPDVVAKMLASVDREKLADFAKWWWRMDPYEVPKSTAGAQGASDAPKA